MSAALALREAGDRVGGQPREAAERRAKEASWRARTAAWAAGEGLTGLSCPCCSRWTGLQPSAWFPAPLLPSGLILSSRLSPEPPRQRGHGRAGAVQPGCKARVENYTPACRAVGRALALCQNKTREASSKLPTEQVQNPIQETTGAPNPFLGVCLPQPAEPGS